MTGQSLLDSMEILNQELQLQAGEADVTRGLLALNIAQDYFEAAAAKRVNVFGSSYGTVNQTASQEYTTFPAGLLRIDRMQLLDATTLHPVRTLTARFHAGDHAPSNSWLVNLVASSPSGKPIAFWTSGSNIWWDPLPDAANTVRYYGLVAAADLTASGTFAYPDLVRLPLASFAVTLLKIGVDDDPSGVSSLSTNLFESSLDLLGNFNRAGATPLIYSQDHR